MTKIFVYAAQPALAHLAQQAVEQLRAAGADQIEVLAELKIPARPPKDNRYLFICETPAEKLAALVPVVLPEDDYAQVLAQWFDTQYHIVKTAEAHKKRAVVVTSSQLQDQAQFIQGINRAWGLALEPGAGITRAQATPEPLLAYIVQNLIQQTPPLRVLANQIKILAGSVEQPMHETDALTGYRALYQQMTALQTQNQQLAAARDHHAHVAHEREQIIGALNHEKAEITAARDSETHRANNQQEESELLLLQLHQVQEELENYFLKYQETEAKLAKQQTRWQRLLEKHPDYIETESVQVKVVDPTTQTLKWVVQGLEGQGIAKDYLEFETFIESGVLGIRFNKTNSRNEPNLKNWPASCDGESMDCIPAGKGNVMRQRALALRELSVSDWKLLNTLPQIIKQNLVSAGLDATLCASITDAVNKLTIGINALPKTFRYDTVTLKSNKVNPDYEHLWFELHNASYDTYYWPKFEFRLGAANIKPGQFSQHPKLEFPLINGKIKPFDSWFEESYDEHGGKYELRFDLIRGIADKETLMKLGFKEQRVVTALASCLPALLEVCSLSYSNMTRLAEKWKDLASATSRLVL